jgi:hypothetical protein
MKTLLNLLLAFAISSLALAARAQDEVPPPMPDDQGSASVFSDAQLDQLTGPVALYPDPLIAVLLPAATNPSQIVQADRYIQNGGDPNQMDTGAFDPNIIALAHYPDVLKWMDDNLNWTTQLGEAFTGQQQDVMNSVQRLRTEAYNLGNLVSTPQQQVINDGGYIEIIPASPSNIYVPDYQPSQVYYQQPYGAPFITFSVGFVIGPWLCGDFDWHNHHLIVWNHDHPRPRNWWHVGAPQRQVYLSKQTTSWQPQNHAYFQPQGDRGWNNNQNTARWVPPGVNTHNFVPPGANNHNQVPPGANNHNFVPPGANNHGMTPPGANNAPHWTPPPVTHPTPAPTPIQRFDQNTQHQQNDSFIGIQNANDARNFSNRGQQSMETATHNESSFHANTGGGGNSQPVRSSGGGGSTAGGYHSSGGGGGGNSGGSNNNQRH